MSDLIADSPYKWKSVIEQLKSFLINELNDIKSIRIIHRCGNCFKKTSDTTIMFDDNKLVIKDWMYNCNFNKEHSHTITIDGYDKDQLLFHIKNEKEYDIGFCLQFKYIMGSEYNVFITPFYTEKDYEIHGEKAYKDRKLRLKQRDTDNGTVILIQNFIDFKGLMPKYSETIHITYKD